MLSVSVSVSVNGPAAIDLDEDTLAEAKMMRWLRGPSSPRSHLT